MQVRLYKALYKVDIECKQVYDSRHIISVVGIGNCETTGTGAQLRAQHNTIR